MKYGWIYERNEWVAYLVDVLPRRDLVESAIESFKEDENRRRLSRARPCRKPNKVSEEDCGFWEKVGNRLCTKHFFIRIIGATLEEVIAARPTANWDDKKGDPTRLIDRAYLSLTR